MLKDHFLLIPVCEISVFFNEGFWYSSRYLHELYLFIILAP